MTQVAFLTVVQLFHFGDITLRLFTKVKLMNVWMDTYTHTHTQKSHLCLKKGGFLVLINVNNYIIIIKNTHFTEMVLKNNVLVQKYISPHGHSFDYNTSYSHQSSNI